MFSTPAYPGLTPRREVARRLLVAQGEGAQAILDLFAKAFAGFGANSEIFYARSRGDDAVVAALQALNPKALHLFPSADSLLYRFENELLRAFRGTEINVAGPANFLAKILAKAQACGFDPTEAQTELRGSKARRVQCVHCKAIEEAVVHSIYRCSCGLNLFVRDHYSQRLGAFQGVCVDAEQPGEIPPAEALYP